MSFEVRLPQALTIRTAAEVRDELLSVLQTARAVHIDASALEEVDVTAFQLLLSARLEGGRTGKPVTVTLPAAGPVRELAALCGIAGALT